MDPPARPLSPLVAQAPAAQAPAARQFAAWLAAFNSGDRGALAAYHQEHFDYQVASEDVASLERELGLSQGTGGFDLKRPESPSATRLVAVLKERRSEQFARATMEVEASEPHRVVRFELHPIPTPEEFLSPEERAARQVDVARRQSLVEGMARELQAHYVAPDMASRMVVALRAHLARGDYDQLSDGEAFAAAVTRDLRDVSHDLHLGLLFGRGAGDPEPTPEELRAMARGANHGFGQVQRLPGNIAHLVINGFPPVLDDEARERVGALMSQVADADALLVDLRANGGGSPQTVALVASYLFDPAPVHLNDMYSRDTGKVEQSWTLRTLRGTRFGGQKPVYVLTSRRTFSGGEEFAYDLQSLRRAKVVGERTGGGAHPVEPHALDGWFTAMVPSGRPINPVTRTNWEGVGVQPDVAVNADAALDQAHHLAIDEMMSRGRRPAPR